VRNEIHALLADKFIKDKDTLRKLKEMLSMGAIAEMIVHDRDIEITKNMLKEGYPIKSIQRIAGLDEETIRKLQAEIESQP